jgi:hypothetical protein
LRRQQSSFPGLVPLPSSECRFPRQRLSVARIKTCCNYSAANQQRQRRRRNRTDFSISASIGLNSERNIGSRPLPYARPADAAGCQHASLRFDFRISQGNCTAVAKAHSINSSALRFRPIGKSIPIARAACDGACDFSRPALLLPRLKRPAASGTLPEDQRGHSEERLRCATTA